MVLYRILFVDEDKENRDAIISKIDWANCGFKIAGTAGNAQEALEWLHSLQPDLIIANAEMPGTDGFELYKTICEKDLNIRFVMISEFDNYHYANKAISMENSEFILKPINIDNLKFSLRRLKRQIDKERIEKQKMQVLQEHYNQSLPIIEKQCLINLIEDRTQPDRLLEQAMINSLGLISNNNAVAVAQMNTYNMESIIKERNFNLNSMKKLIEENLEQFCESKSFIYGSYVVIIVNLDETCCLIKDFIGKVNRICKISKQFLGFGISIGVGEPCSQQKSIRQSFLGALEALEYRIFMEENQALYVADIDVTSDEQKLRFSEQDEFEIFGALKLGDEDEVGNVVDKLFSRFDGSKFTIRLCRIFITDMMMATINLVRNYRLEIDEVFGNGFKAYLDAMNFDSLNNLKNWFYQSCINLNSLIKRDKLHVTKLAVEKAKQFINENYSNSQISVEMLCSYLQMSPAYFSTVFKKESGMSFVGYLTNVRMQNAVNLLTFTKEKSCDIAALIGYTDPNYFSHVFKKHFGVSPSKYRSS